jgi:hypothetical protein
MEKVMKFLFEHHVDEESIELYALGRLDETRAEVFEEHILICEHCRTRLTATDLYVQAMRLGTARLLTDQNAKVATASPWDSFRKLFQMPVLGLAAVALAVFLVTVRLPHASQNQAAMDQPVISVALTAERGETISALAHRKLNLQLDARGLDLGPNARVEIVNSQGKAIENITAPEVSAKILAHTNTAFPPGAYFIRLYAPGSQEMVREFGLNLN